MRIMAFLRLIFCTPKAKTMVTIAGSPSGMAATARLTAVMNISTRSLPLRRPKTKIKAQIPIATSPKVLPKTAKRFCRGVSTSGDSWMSWAILPISVFMPVAVTAIFPRPYVTIVLLKTILIRSPMPAFGSCIGSVPFSTGTDSPVRADSSVVRFTASISLPSAGTKSPSSIRTMSPGTSSEAGRFCGCPSLSTLACGELSLRRAAKDFSAFLSCHTPKMALVITIKRITTASVTSLTRYEIRAAANRSRISGSVSCRHSMANTVGPFCSASSFGPY